MGSSLQTCKQSCCSTQTSGGDLRPGNAPSTTDEDFGAQQPSNLPGLSLPTHIETADSRTRNEHTLGWEESNQEQETDFGGPLPVPDGLEKLQAERAEAAAKEKEKKDREAREKKARDKKARDAKEKAERLAKEKAAQEAKETAEREAKEREAEDRKRMAENAGMPPGSKLEICLDNGWQPVGDEEFKQIENHLAGGETKFAIQARGAMYVVDFTDPKNPTQANAMSGKARKLRVVQ